MVRVGRFEYKKSTNPSKKLMVTVEKDGKKRTVHFGARSMEHFRDKTGIWKSKDHGDATRRKSFRARMSGIIKKDGTKAVSDPFSPAYHALRILW